MRRGKGSTVPSDNQAREKLALYVYEYLLHVGAQKAAQTFLSETTGNANVCHPNVDQLTCKVCLLFIRWEKNITLGEPPGFLHSWWCVFWDLYCAAPERRDTCEHSSEAKAFHDYNPSAPSPLGQMPPNEGMPGGPIGPGGFFPVFMSPRYPGGPRPGVRMAQQVDFNPPGGVPGQPMMPNSMDPSRQGPPGMSPMNPRMNPPRGQPLGTMNPGNYGAIRPPPNSGMGPGGPGMSMPGPVGRPWQPNASTISYSSASPGGHYGPPVSSTGPPVPGTPIMPNPQGTAGPYSPAAPRMNAPNTRRDSSNSGGDGMYTLMKTVPGGNMPGFPMGPGPDGPMGPMGPDMGPPVMNGMSSTGDGLDGMKNSPANGPGTPREDGPPMSEFGIPGYGQENMPGDTSGIDMQCHLQACAGHQGAPL
ncbi:single-stranded DNA-binding protein 3-like isoform X34 [Tachypleus tridentatus]|uniref:single-stranded DNA-binding protein 3-like isoform X34 n=1 Tax=Tachypleus tridentatus TaxID=6853 RepID=UPI003FD60ADA